MTDFDLFEDLGLDPGDPETLAARDDARIHHNLIETLVKMRKDRRLRQTVVAERMGTTQSRVSDFERIGGDPRLSTILRYARAVDAKVHIAATPVPRGWESLPARIVTHPTAAARPPHKMTWASMDQVAQMAQVGA